MRMENPTIKIGTTFNADTGEIFQETDMTGQIYRTVIATQEKQIRDALIALGWTPPGGMPVTRPVNAYAKGVTRACDNCGAPYQVRQSDLDRGWGKCCSKACAASHREKKSDTLPVTFPKLDAWKYQTPPDKAYLGNPGPGDDYEDDF